MPEILLTEIRGEPRARDMDIAEKLGFERPRKIRDLIKANAAELATFGPSPRVGAMVDIGSGAKREVLEYWVNEEQALLIATMSEAPNAPAVRAILIRTFGTEGVRAYWLAITACLSSVHAPEASRTFRPRGRESAAWVSLEAPGSRPRRGPG